MRSALETLVAAVILASTAQGQGLHVRVVDATSGTAVAGVAVTIVDPANVAVLPPRLTDSAGVVVFSPLEPGRYRVRARRIGIGAALSDIKTIQPGTLIEVTLRVKIVEQTLDTVRVVARSYEERLLQLRKSLGGGRVLTSRDLDSLVIVDLVDAVRTTPGASVYRNRDGTLTFGIRQATAPPGCRKNFFLNGALMSIEADDRGAFTALMGIDIKQVALVEVWPDRLTLPPEFAMYNACGAVAVWTRKLR